MVDLFTSPPGRLRYFTERGCVCYSKLDYTASAPLIVRCIYMPCSEAKTRAGGLHHACSTEALKLHEDMFNPPSDS